MDKFIIGQYGGFDAVKMRRDFREGFWGVEACMFGTDQHAESLLDYSRSNGFRVGVHYPFRQKRSHVRDALFMSTDPMTRRGAYMEMEKEFERVAPLSPSYILFHYPKPVILDRDADWTSWKFSKEEYEWSSDYLTGRLEDSSELLFRWLSEKGREFGFVPVLELDALSSFIYESDFLEKLLHTYPSIRLCLDTGRLYLQNRTDPKFSALALMERYAKYAHHIHLSTMKFNRGIEHYHHPVLPELHIQDGWAPIEEYIRVISKENPNVLWMFEHRSDHISDDDLERCYNWVEYLIR